LSAYYTSASLMINGPGPVITSIFCQFEKTSVSASVSKAKGSEQDSDRYDSKQQRASAGGSFTFGSMTGSANVNLSRNRM